MTHFQGIPEALSKDQKRALEHFLSAPAKSKACFAYLEVLGFLTALVASPELIMPSEWIPLVLGQEEGVFKGQVEAEEVTGALLTLYNQINNQFRSKGLSVPVGFQETGPILDLFQESSPTSSWCRGFADGYHCFIEGFEDYFPPDFKEEINACCYILMFFGDEAHSREGYESLTEKQKTFEEHMAFAHKVFLEALKSFNEEMLYFLEQWAKATEGQ